MEGKGRGQANNRTGNQLARLCQSMIGLDRRVRKLVESTAKPQNLAVAFKPADGGRRRAGRLEFCQARHPAISEKRDHPLLVALPWVDHGSSVRYSLSASTPGW